MSIEGGGHEGEVTALVGEQEEEEEVVVPAFLHTALHNDYGEYIIDFLTHVDAGRLERCLPAASVFGATPLLRIAAGRLNNAAEATGTEGATYVDLDADREDDDAGRTRVTWAREIGWIHLAAGRFAAAAGKKKMISGGAWHSLVVSGSTGKVWSFGGVALVDWGMEVWRTSRCRVLSRRWLVWWCVRWRWDNIIRSL